MAQPCVRQSEIFLNFAPPAHPPPRHLLLPSHPTNPLSPLCCATDLLHIVSPSHMQQRKRHRKREREKWSERKDEEACSNPVLPVSQLDEEITRSEFWAECCMICRLGMWTPSGALRPFLGHSHFLSLSPPPPPLPFVPLSQLSHSQTGRHIASQTVINYVFSPFHYIHHLPLFTVHSPFLFALLIGLALTYFQGSWALLLLYLPLSFPLFFLFHGALFVNVQRRRMREQIMKHRSAFHTLFRKNSPTAQRGRGATSPCDSTPTFSPYGSFYVCSLWGCLRHLILPY